MKDQLPTTQLANVIEVVMGQAPAGKDCNRQGNGTPFVKVGEFGAVRPVLREWTTDPKRLARKSDVLLCVVGATCGKINLGEDCAIGRSVAALRPVPGKIDQRYLYRFMQLKVEEMRAGSVGAAQTVISRQMICEVEIPLPSLPEQKRIVAILDEAFEGIDRAIANTERNLANARELFDGQRNAALSKSGNDWVERRLDEICQISSKLVDPKKPEYVDLPHLGAGNMASKTGEITDVKTARQESLISGKFLFDVDTVLYSKIRPYLMKACRPDFQGLCSADVYPLVPNLDFLTKGFLFHVLMSAHFTDYAIGGSDRAGMPKVNRKHLFKYSFFVPTVPEQLAIAEMLDQVGIRVSELEDFYQAKRTSISELKQSILQKALAGELTSSGFHASTFQPASSSPERTALVLAFAYDQHERARRQKTFGRVKAQKLLHLTESIVGFDLGRSPIKDAAGPNDFPHMLRAENWAREHDFFEFRERPSGGYSFTKLSRYDECVRDATPDNSVPYDRIRDVVNILLPMNSDQAEVFATVHAAWNNLILDGADITNDAIILEARENWHPDKLKIPVSAFEEAIRQIWANGLVPDGSAKRVGGQEKLI